jgi:hypothetical protein
MSSKFQVPGGAMSCPLLRKALTPGLSRGEREYLRRRVCFAHAAIKP